MAGLMPQQGSLAQPVRPVARGAFDGLFKVKWSLTYVGFLAYTFVIVTFKGGIGTLAIGLAVLGLLQHLGRIVFPAPMKWLAVYVAWSLLGSLGSPFPEVTGVALEERIKVAIIALAAFNALRTRPQIRLYLVLFLAAFTLVPARAALVNWVSGYRLFGRAIGSFVYSNPNDLAAITLLAVAMGLALLAMERRGSIIWACAALATPVLMLLILLTQSRGAILALALMGLFFAIGVIRKRPKALVAILGVAAVTFAITPDAVWERLAGLRKLSSSSTVAEADPEGSARERFALLKNGSAIAAENPVFGVGLGAFAYANEAYDPAVGLRDAHNMYLTVAAETGVPGFVFFVLMLASTLKAVSRARRAARGILPAEEEQLRILALGLVALMAAGVFGTYSKLSFFYLYVALVWCVSDQLMRDAKAMALAMAGGQVPLPPLAPVIAGMPYPTR